jgi:hypothetical protein
MANEGRGTETPKRLDNLPDTRLIPFEDVDRLLQEADELAAIVVASRRTARKNGKK